MDVTWDGVPIARENPTAVVIVTWRKSPDGEEFLLLHRLGPGGPDYEGDWAWTPPAGARQPGEDPGGAASRDLYEETELVLPLTRLPDDAPTDGVALFVTEVSMGREVVLDHGHDRHTWLPLDQAIPMCLPSVVARV